MIDELDVISYCLMSEEDHYFFSKKYRVIGKDDDDIFNIKYHIYTGQNDVPDNFQKKSSDGKKRKKSNDLQIVEKQADKSTDKDKKRQNRRKLRKKEASGEKKTGKEGLKESNDDEIVEFQMVEMKDKVQEEEEQQLYFGRKERRSHFGDKYPYSDDDDLSGQEQREDAFWSSDSDDSDNSASRNRSYKDLVQIGQSRVRNEGKYYRGRIEFSEDLKWSAKIISDEYQGFLVAQGTNLNRSLHEDQVFFTVIQENKQRVMCSVVAIAKRRSASIVGKIEFLKHKNCYLVKPINKRISKLLVDESSMKKEWISQIQALYFLVEFTEWKEEEKYPSCKIVGEYGAIGSIDVQAKALLRNHGIEYMPYTQGQKNKLTDMLGDSFKNGQFVIPESERKVRKDFRKWKTFIIKDNSYDFAISIFSQMMRTKSDPNFLRKNMFDINVHFMDVAYFAPESSFIDELLKKRFNAFDTIFKVLPLLPEPILSATTFSVNKERMVLSVCLTVDEDGQILDSVKISKSIVSPECAFSHDQLLQIIRSQQISQQEYKLWNCGPKIYSQVQAYIKDAKLVYELMSKVRAKRIEEGSFDFQPRKKLFQLGTEGRPLKFQLVEKDSVDFMLKECLISSQKKIGEYLFKNMKEKAILYRHKFPGQKRLEKLRELAMKMGYPILNSIKSEFHKQVNSLIVSTKVKPFLKQAIQEEVLAFLSEADYFITENFDPKAWNNYAINIPIYSHCSSPTKRYGDILVQRQIIQVISKIQWKIPELQTKRLLQLCNRSMQIMKRTKSECEKILFCQSVKDSPVFTTAVVIEVEKWGARISVPSYQFKTVVKFGKIQPLKIVKYDSDVNHRKFVKLDFQFKQNGGGNIHFTLKELREIEVRITATKSFPLNYHVNLVVSDPQDANKKIIVE